MTTGPRPDWAYKKCQPKILLFSQFQKRRGQAVSSFFELQKQQKALAKFGVSYLVFSYFIPLLNTIRNFTFDCARLYLDP